MQNEDYNVFMDNVIKEVNGMKRYRLAEVWFLCYVNDVILTGVNKSDYEGQSSQNVIRYVSYLLRQISDFPDYPR